MDKKTCTKQSGKSEQSEQFAEQLVGPSDPMSVFDYQKMEYSRLATEVAAAELAITTLLHHALLGSVTLLAALVTLSTTNWGEQIPIWPLLFTLPLCILIPASQILLSHRRLIHRLGTHIQVFFDEAGTGSRWETRWTRFHGIKVPGKEPLNHHTLTFVPQLIWVFYLLVSLAAVFVCFHGASSWVEYLSCFAAVTSPQYFIRRFKQSWHECPEEYRNECINRWRLLRAQELSE